MHNDAKRIPTIVFGEAALHGPLQHRRALIAPHSFQVIVELHVSITLGKESYLFRPSTLPLPPL